MGVPKGDACTLGSHTAPHVHHAPVTLVIPSSSSTQSRRLEEGTGEGEPPMPLLQGTPLWSPRGCPHLPPPPPKWSKCGLGLCLSTHEPCSTALCDREQVTHLCAPWSPPLSHGVTVIPHPGIVTELAKLMLSMYSKQQGAWHSPSHC